MQHRREIQAIALLIPNRDVRCGWVVNATPRPHYSQEVTTAPIVKETGSKPGPIWKGMEKGNPEF
jgi:hypothetical protein